MYAALYEKRSKVGQGVRGNPEYGVDNPLFYKDNALMLFGDAKKVVDEIETAMQA